MERHLSSHRPLASLARRLLFVSVLTAAAGLSGGLAGSGVASAASPSGGAFLRTAHLSPDTPGVDVYVLTAKALRPTVIRNETYGHFSPYLVLPAGTYAVSTRLAGSAATAKPLVSWHMTLTAGDAYTAAVLGTGAERRGAVLHDDLTPPAKGKARVRFIQAASNAPMADVTANGNVPVAVNAHFASVTGYVSLPAGTWPLTAQSTGGKRLHVAESISLASGSVTSIVLLDKPGGGLSLASALDSAAAGVTPVKGINTGGGGLAHGREGYGGPGAPMALTIGLLSGAAVLVGRRRRAR